LSKVVAADTLLGNGVSG